MGRAGAEPGVRTAGRPAPRRASHGGRTRPAGLPPRCTAGGWGGCAGPVPDAGGGSGRAGARRAARGGSPVHSRPGARPRGAPRRSACREQRGRGRRRAPGRAGDRVPVLPSAPAPRDGDVRQGSPARDDRDRFGDDRRAGAPVGGRVGPEHQGLQGVQWRGGAHPPGGVGPPGRAVGCELHSPPGPLLDAVVSPAQGEQVACRGATDRPGPHVVEVAEPGGHRAAREAAATVAGANQRHELSTRAVGVGREVVARVEAGAGQRVARHELRPSTLHASPRARRALREVVAQPGAAHEQRLGRPCPLHLDQVVVVTADLNAVDRRGGVAADGILRAGVVGGCLGAARPGGGQRLGLVDARCLGPVRDHGDGILRVVAGCRSTFERCRRRRVGPCGRCHSGGRAGRCRSGGRAGRCRVRAAGLGRDREHDLHVDGRVAGDQVGEGLAPSLLDVRAGAVCDEVVGEAVDGSPRRGGVLAGEGAVPLVDTRLGDPPAQARRCPGSLRPLAHQIGGDAREQHPGAPPKP